VPFALLEVGKEPGTAKPGKGFTEKLAAATGLKVDAAHTLMDHITGITRLW
jgi:hypothetical protein